jgi:L-cysteate sulfo-lyase
VTYPLPARHARLPLLAGDTPVQAMQRLSARLGGPSLYVKRDDLIDIGGGGSKLRKLEYLVGEAQAQGADTLIALGALQSNHARLSAAVAVRAGMQCEILLSRRVPRTDEDYEQNGNMLLDGLFGARVQVHAADADLMALAQARAEALTHEGRRPYIIPFGGSSALGSLGYARAAAEIARQSAQMGVRFHHVVLANGSAGTQAGLLAGFHFVADAPCVTAYSVLAPAATQAPLTAQLAQATLDLMQPGQTLSPASVQVDDSQLGPGYGQPTEAMREALRLVAGTEALLLDPVYTGKAFAGLLQGIRDGRFTPGENVLFLATGGLPGLFAYRREFAAQSE